MAQDRKEMLLEKKKIKDQEMAEKAINAQKIVDFMTAQ